MYRRTAALFIDGLAAGHDVLDGLQGVAELLLMNAEAWKRLEAEWEEQHDWLILGVPLPQEAVRQPTRPRTGPPSTVQRVRTARFVPRSQRRPDVKTRRKQAQVVDCPHCGAKAGEPCHTPSGNLAPWPHMKRAQRTYLKK